MKGKDVTISGNLQLTGVNGEIITGVDADKTITITGTPSGDGVMFGAEDDDLSRTLLSLSTIKSLFRIIAS